MVFDVIQRMSFFFADPDLDQIMKKKLNTVYKLKMKKEWRILHGCSIFKPTALLTLCQLLHWKRIQDENTIPKYSPNCHYNDGAFFPRLICMNPFLLFILSAVIQIVLNMNQTTKYLILIFSLNKTFRSLLMLPIPS